MSGRGPVPEPLPTAFKPIAHTPPPSTTIQSMPDGTRVEFGTDGLPVRQWNPDGSVLTYDGHGRPAVETLLDHTTFTFRPDGSATERSPDGTVVDLDANLRPVREVTPAGVVFTTFDGKGRPLTGTLPGGVGVRYEYLSGGDVQIRFSTGLQQRDDAHGNTVWERLSDGTTYTSFDGKGRPLGGTDPQGHPFALRYDARGDVIQTFQNHSVVETDPQGHPVREVTATGVVFTGFDDQGRPTRGTGPGTGGFTLTYDAGGNVTEHFADRSWIETDPAGRPIRQQSADGTLYTAFDDQGRPTHGSAPGTGAFALRYAPGGDVIETFANGSSVEVDQHHRLVRQVAPDGTVFTDFDSQGRPRQAFPAGGAPFTLTYDPSGNVTEHFADNSTLVLDPGRRPIRQVTADGRVFTNFDDQGRPTRGILPGNAGNFTMTYDAHGDAFEHLPDNTTVETDPGGHVIKEIAPDGTTFIAFDDQGRPTEGTTKDGQHFTITYDAKGDIFEHINGSTIETDPHGHPIRMWTPDGTEITWAVDIPALHNAAVQVGSELDTIQGNIASLKSVFVDVEDMWDTPAGWSLHPLVDTFNRVSDSLVRILQDAVLRMNRAYDNYVSTETTNTKNLS